MVEKKTRINISIDKEILAEFTNIYKGNRSEFIEAKMKEYIYSCSEKELLLSEKEGIAIEIDSLVARSSDIDKQLALIEEEERKNALNEAKVEKAMNTIRNYAEGTEELTLDVIKRIASTQKLNYRVLVGKANEEGIKFL